MRSLGPFFPIALGLAWGLFVLLVLFTDQIEAIFGPVSGTNPVFVLAVYAPGIAGVLHRKTSSLICGLAALRH